MFGDWLWFQIPIVALQILSRLGHMSYDVVGQQILQTGIPESKANLIGTTEVSVASLAESIMLGVAIVANDVSHFRFLAILSLLSVVGATWLFCRWLMNPTETQRSLFAFDSPKWCNVGLFISCNCVYNNRRPMILSFTIHILFNLQVLQKHSS